MARGINPTEEFVGIRRTRAKDQVHLAYDPAFASEAKNLKPEIQARMKAPRRRRTRVR